MPFRLLGMVVDPDQAGTFCGRTFARYAASGVDITLACVSAGHWKAAQVDGLRGLGVRDVVLLDYHELEVRAADLEPVLGDLLASLRPHVVIAEGGQSELAKAARAAFDRTRHGSGSGSLPAKLYSRAAAGSPVPVTTRIEINRQPEYFVRVRPAPWVTGVLETDLFAGIREAAASADELRLAS